MALFSKTKKETTAKREPKAKREKKSHPLPPVTRDISRVIVRPVVTEKSAVMGDRNVFTFEIARSATKIDVRDAVRKLWNVVPAKINIVNQKPRAFVVRARNRKGTHPGMRKAYVYLRKGDTIELV